jgi:hypothetical protein
LGLLGGGVGVFLLKAYADWHNAKRGDKKDVVGAWQEIADRESARLGKLETRVAMLEKVVLEKEVYINQLERVIVGAGLSLPEEEETKTDAETMAQ